MNDLCALDVIRGKLAEKKITNERMRLKIGISSAYVSMMLNGKCATGLDSFLFFCKEAGVDPLQLRKNFRDDFHEGGGISAIGWRPRDND